MYHRVTQLNAIFAIVVILSFRVTAKDAILEIF